jgi:hypothetical protein
MQNLKGKPQPKLGTYDKLLTLRTAGGRSVARQSAKSLALRVAKISQQGVIRSFNQRLFILMKCYSVVDVTLVPLRLP